tara:strand:+ start:63958 stop:64785 length:828 start_codon:yes stop_codon:yes gene_type:complete
VQIRQVLQQASSRLLHSDTPTLDAEILLAQVLNKSREFLLTWPESKLDQAQLQAFEQLLEQRASGQPIAYLTGKQSFWDFELKVNADVLIPRPETELLVELALELLPENPIELADLGTGSGAIALALAKERPQWQITATDYSADALNVARSNALDLHLSNLTFIQGDWCKAISGRQLDAIVSNPPYVDKNDSHISQGDLRFEPLVALAADDQGMADLKVIARQARDLLKPGALILLEHGYQQGPAVRQVLEQSGYNDIQTHKDLAGLDRISQARK